MKKYLEIYVGSRGYLENVEVKEFEDIEKYLEEESVENRKEIEKEFEGSDKIEYRDELLDYYKWEKFESIDVCYLGLGDEEIKYYISVDDEIYLEWKKKYNIDSDDFSNVDDEIIDNLLGIILLENF